VKIASRSSIVAAARRVQDALGGAAVLVNNAGVMLLGPFSAELSPDYRRMIETNLRGAITTTEVFLDQLIADGGGDLVNLSSVAGRTARPGNAVYAEVRVIVIEPGAVLTELTDHITHAETKAAAEQMYDATAIAPQDIAQIVAFPVSRPQTVSLNEILVRPAGQAG
jgi:NADP-dependent 3-hydroxy acid dehydrogenase YdfG